ncbi:MAG: hypothetical protein ACRDMH_00295 [Solirubrobacterales bacterium]
MSTSTTRSKAPSNGNNGGAPEVRIARILWRLDKLHDLNPEASFADLLRMAGVKGGQFPTDKVLSERLHKLLPGESS